MEPPPLTLSKRRDPLRDGVVFPAVAQDSPGPLQLARPSPLPQAGPASGGLPSSSLLRTAAEAAAINRSMEAQQIRRQWDALVGASPLPQAFRHGLSPASVGRPALGGYASPAVRAQPLYQMHMPSAHGTGLAPGYGSVAPSAMYRSSVQQRQQEQRQQQQQQQQVTGMEVEASKYTHILHSHSPGYQAVVSSTVQVMRQSGPTQVLPPAPRHTLGSGGGSGGVSIEELPAGAIQQQQQEQRPSAAAHPQPVMVLNVPLLPSPAAAAPQQQQQQQHPRLSPQQVAAALAAVPLSTSAMPSGAGEAAPTMPMQGPGDEVGQGGSPGGMPAPRGPWQLSQQALQQTADADLAHAGSLVHPLGDPGGLAGQAGELGGAAQSPAALGVEASECHSMEAALAQVGAMVRDLQTPIPDDETEAEGDEGHRSQQHQQVGPASSAAAAAPGGGHAGGPGQPPGAEQGDREQQMTLAESPQQQQHHQHHQHGAPALDGLPEQPALAAQAQPAPARKEQRRESKGERRPRRTTAVTGAAALPVAAADVGSDSTAAATAGAGGPVAQREQEMLPGPSAPLDASDSGAADLPSQQQASSSKAKERQAGSKGVRKRVKAEAASSKRRTMLLRVDAAKVEPLHRALGGDAAPGGNAIETTRSGRHRIKPLPFWANSRLVLNSNKDVVGIEQREDLLGISHQPGQQPKRGQAVKSEPSKPAGGGAAAKPPRPAGKGTAQSKGAGNDKQHPGKAARPQQQQQQQRQAEQLRRGRQREAKAKQAQHEQEGPAEVEAALQLQQLGRGEDAAAPPALPIVQQPRTAAACPPRTAVGALGLAALAASAGAQAARAATPQREAGTSAGATAKRAPRSSAAAATATAAAEDEAGMGGGKQATEALPAVPGVPKQVIRDLAQLPDAERRKKCGHCKHCLQPSLKQGCLALRTLRSWETEQQQEGKAPAAAATAVPPAVAQQAGGGKQAKGSNHKSAQQALPAQAQQAKRGKRLEQQGSQAQQGPQPTAAGKAKGRKRAAAAEQQAPSPKKARGRPRQQQSAEQAEESPPPDPGPQVAAGGGQEQDVEQDVEQEEADEQGWTASQAAALQRAWLQIDPTASNFWQLVAKQVPGKTATECYNRHMARHPTPPHPTRKAAPRKYLAAAQEGARLPDIKPGASKQVMQNAARKYTRQLQWQQKASKAQEAGDGGGLSSELVEEMEAAERKDRYIDQILRKRQGRPLGMAARGRKPAGAAWPPAAPSQHPAQPGVQAGGPRSGQAVGCEQEVRAALAGLQAHHSEEDRDSQEDSDYYWSDA